MSIPQNALLAFLKELHLFKNMAEEDIAQIAEDLGEMTLAPDDLLFAEGDRGYTFYIIYSGRVKVWRKDKKNKEVALGVMEAGDKFGEAAPLFNRPRSASITALEETVLLTMPHEVFNQMLSQHPDTKLSLRAIAKSYKQARKMKLAWIHDDEVIHLIARRHPAQMWINAIKPTLLAFATLIVFLTAGLMPLPGFALMIRWLCGGLLLLSGFWLAWEVVDWRNDYFIVTDQRVVWLEQVLFLSASRQETPMSAVQSVDVTTNQLGRIFKFGDVFVRTFTGIGSLKLTFVENPHNFEDIIKEKHGRVGTKRDLAETVAMRHSIREILGLETAVVVPPPLPDLTEPEQRQFSLVRTREVEGDTITYHKHWWVLLVKIPIPLLGTILLIAFVIYMQFFGPKILSPLALCSSAFLLELVFLIQMLYQYIDWHNDLYRLTKDTIIDSEKKPFGSEVTKSAPIKNIQSIEHSREGILRLILNFGTVKVNVAEAVLDFIDVTNPAIVQQDIFYRQENIKFQAEQAQAQAEKQRMAEWMKAYHDVSEAERAKADKEDKSQED